MLATKPYKKEIKIVKEKNANTEIDTSYEVALSKYRKNKNKKMFEKVIEDMMLDKHFTETYKHCINDIKGILKQHISSYRKRFAILSLLGDSLKILRDLKIYTDSKIPKMEHMQDLVEKLKKYVKIGVGEQAKYGEVMTPISTVIEKLNKLPRHVWSNPKLKWFDSCNGSGAYLAMVVAGLMKGLVEWEPDEEKRYKHILENMVYAGELQPKNMFLWMFLIDPYDTYNLNIYTGSYLEKEFDNHMKEVWGIKRFNIIIGNPPYQIQDGGNAASAKPLYNLFVEKAITMCDILLYITPSRWFAGGKGLDKYRQNMLNCSKIELIKHFPGNGSDVFGSSVDIPGGVSYFLYNNSYSGLCSFNGIEIDLSANDIVLMPENYSLVNKMSKYTSISEICNGRGDNTFGIQTNDERLVDDKSSDSHITCYVSQQKGFKKWIDKTVIKQHNDIDSWKVITARANGEKPNFGNKFVGTPDDVCSGSYIWFITKTEEEAKSLISYMNCKLINYLLSLRKISQDIKPDTCKWIPIVPFDRIWDDEQLFEYFGISEDEKKLISK